jgi:hypothetical protein
MSMWAEPEGSSGYSSGEGLCLIDPDDAREHAERIGLNEEDMTAAGFTVTEG